MLDNIIFSANAVFPLIILIFLGMLLKRRGKLFPNPKDFFTQVEKFVFNVALPVYIFNEIAQAKVEKAFDIRLVIYCISAILILCSLLVLITPFFIKDKRTRGAFINGICRPNFVLLGVPLVSNLTNGAGSATAALIIPFMVLLFNSLGAVILTVYSDETQENNIKKIFIEILKNPLIRAILIGLPFMIFGIELPQILQKSINYIGNTATPMALISLGAGVDLSVLKSKIKLSLTAALIKTALSPVLFVAPAYFMGFGSEALAVIYVLSASPSAVASYIMAKNMNSDAELAGEILALTTIICPATIFIGSLVLKSMGVI